MGHAVTEVEIKIGKVYWCACVYGDSTVRVYANGDFMSDGLWDGARLSLPLALASNPAIPALEAELQRAT